MKKILITGGLGHIGSKLLQNLSKNRSYKLIVIDNLLTQRYSSLFFFEKNNKFKFYNSCISDPNIEYLFKGVDVVIHLAAIVDAANSFGNEKEVKKINYLATKKIIDYCSKYKCKLIFPSTTSVYGTSKKIVDENCSIEDLKCQSPYAVYKLKTEIYLNKYSKKNKINFVILRLGTIFGSTIGMRFQTAVNKFCWLATLGEPITVWKTALHQKRPYLGLNDAIKCFEFIIEKNLFKNTIYNVVSANNTVNEIISYIKFYKKNVKIKFVKTKIMNQLSYEVKSEKINKEGFKCTQKLKEGIGDTIKTLQGIKND